MFGQEVRWVKKNINEATRDAIVDRLASRCAAGAEGVKERYPPDRINYHSTAALALWDPEDGKRKRRARELAEEPTTSDAFRAYLGKKLDGESKRWWEVLVTGATRTGERLNVAETTYRGTQKAN